MLYVVGCRIGFVYVEIDQVRSIKKHGYLSARRQYELNPDLFGPTLEVKYQQQLSDALHHPSYGQDLALFLEDAHAVTHIQKILAYLDWRDETTLRGSRSVYFLFAPIPKSLEREFERKRGPFLQTRVCLHLAVPDVLPVTVVGGDFPVSFYWQCTTKDWEAVYRQALANNKSNSLWFDGIPHAYVTPEDGVLQVMG